MKKQNLVISAVIILVILGILIYFMPSFLPKKSQPPPFHEHANFALFLEGVQYNFNQSKYMTNESNEIGKRQFVHLHDMNGGVIHLHASNITLGMFFDSIGVKFNSTCFVLDDGTSYCNSGDNTLKMFVNGVQSYEYDNLQLHDLDKVLISYGNDSSQNIQNQISSIPSDACIYSEKCPAPPGFFNNESVSCVGGQATVCSAK